MSSSVEKKEFKSELKQILSLITHSLYSHKEVFLRELISNASDAIDKIRFNSLNNETLLENNKNWKIKIIADPKNKTLTVSDNGIGMSRSHRRQPRHHRKSGTRPSSKISKNLKPKTVRN